MEILMTDHENLEDKVKHSFSIKKNGSTLSDKNDNNIFESRKAVSSLTYNNKESYIFEQPSGSEDLPEPGPDIHILHMNSTPNFIVHPYNNSLMNATVFFSRLMEKSVNGIVKTLDIPRDRKEYKIVESAEEKKFTSRSNCEGCSLSIEFSLIKNLTYIPILNDKVFRVNKNSYKWSFMIESWPFKEVDNGFEIEMQLQISSPVITTESKNYKDSGEEITRIILKTLYFEVRLSLPHLAIVDDSVVLYVVPELIKISQDLFIIKASLPYFAYKILYDPDITVIQTAEVKPKKEQPGFVLEAWHLVVMVIAVFLFVVGIVVVIMYLKKRKELKEAEKRWKSAADV